MKKIKLTELLHIPTDFLEAFDALPTLIYGKKVSEVELTFQSEEELKITQHLMNVVIKMAFEKWEAEEKNSMPKEMKDLSDFINNI